VRKVFDNVLRVRQLNGNARDVADQLFFETVVRLHRAGEAPRTPASSRWPIRRAGDSTSRACRGNRFA
jgi:Family of unknown function (DUF6448)